MSPHPIPRSAATDRGQTPQRATSCTTSCTTPCAAWVPRDPGATLAAWFASLLLATSLLTAPTTGWAGPGAHGPNGEHLDTATATPTGPAFPQVQAASDLFELVALLKPGELVLTLDRYATNEPVADARIELASGALKAVALYRPATQDYAITDTGLLQALAQAGEHALVFTVQAGADADLLDGTLAMGAGAARAATAGHGPGNSHDHDHDHDHGHGHSHTLERVLIGAGGLAALGVVGGGLYWRRRRSARATGGTR
jgi:hypothetical protein